MMKVIIVLFLCSFVSLQVDAETAPGTTSKTLSGAPRNSDIIFHMKRICVSKSMAGTGGLLPIKPALEIGAFRAEYDLEQKNMRSKLNSIPSFRRVEFSKHAKKVNKRSLGAKEYIFEDYTIKIPVEDLEIALSEIERPRASNMVDRLLDSRSKDKKERFVQMAGFYVKIDNVRSFVAFDGENSNVSSKLKDKDTDGYLVYERVFPKVATMLSSSRSIRSDGKGHISHLDPAPDCGTRTSFDYDVEVVGRTARAVNPVKRDQGLR